MKVTTVFFDFGGTLAHYAPPGDDPIAVWKSTGAQFGQEFPRSSVEDALEKVTRSLGREIFGYRGRTQEFWRRFDGAILDELGITHDREGLLRAFEAIFQDPSRVVLYPEARSALTKLRALGLRTGLISNHSDELLKILEYHRLTPLFDSVTYSQEVGADKPDPAIFLAALRRSACQASEAVHVGDSVKQDVDGARRSGLIPIWIDRTGRDVPDPCPRIRSLDEIPELLRR
ncbi:MAG TPA: HAD family hydrolase [Thermoplasmata archaeon]|nr:HAD family hydrolase [Thermoplasmata archaeon]